MKKIERNPFNEKLIHRYLFETLYFGDKKVIKSLLPQEYQSKKINIIVPEKEYKQEKYRSDLTIFFRGKKEGVPVEVKWNSKQKIGSNQVSCLKKHKGILISFSTEKDWEIKYPQLKGFIRSIDYDDFILWISTNISKLTKESLIYKAKVNKLRSNSQKWLVFIFGKSHLKWNELMNQKNQVDNWCFRKTEIILKNMFDIQKDDECIFILGSVKGGNMKIKPNPKSNFQYSGWCMAKINEPYYMDVKNDFFEDIKNSNEGDLVWPHFFNFKIDKKNQKNFWLGRKTSDKKNNFGRNLETINYGKRNSLDEYICKSVNNGLGSPVCIPNSEFERLKDTLRIQTERFRKNNF